MDIIQLAFIHHFLLFFNGTHECFAIRWARRANNELKITEHHCK